jgi:hypothetical protein
MKNTQKKAQEDKKEIPIPHYAMGSICYNA